jgi:hypothetical protein
MRKAYFAHVSQNKIYFRLWNPQPAGFWNSVLKGHGFQAAGEGKE